MIIMGENKVEEGMILMEVRIEGGGGGDTGELGEKEWEERGSRGEGG